ncbi:MAG: energy transducer TonB [Bacteroidales bacterium]|nr:energy transducer TonB [Bacteroidales bacterium]
MGHKSKIRNWFSSLPSEDRAGLYITVIIHLAVIIVLLAVQVGFWTFSEKSFILDFSAQEERERIEQEEEFKEDISKRLDDLISAAQSQQGQVRNIAVDASALKDDRGTNAEELYKEAERLQQDLKSNAVMEDARNETVDLSTAQPKNNSDKEYSGPSVVSYTLDGRKASHLSIPAYRCMGGGDVTVIITVDPQGNVVGAKVMESISSTDTCLRDFAIRAARLSRFSALPQDRFKADKTLARQTGEIVYRFIAQ